MAQDQMAQKQVECSNCGTNADVDFGAASYTTYNCGDCGTSNIAFK